MLTDSLSIIVRYSRIFAERKLQKYGVGFPEQMILMYLTKNETVTQDAIAKHFMIDKGAIAKTAGKLHEKGLIERQENPNDKREKLMSISQKGREILTFMGEALSEWNKNIYQGLSEAEVKEVKRITGIMAANVINLMNQNWSDHDGKDS